MNEMTTSMMKKALLVGIAENKKIFNLIDNKEAKYPNDLIGINLFPHMKIDFTEQQTGTYIGIKIDSPSISEKNDLYKNSVLTVMITSHNSHLMTTDRDSRVDHISEALIEMLNWNDDYGSMLRLKSDTEDPLDTRYYCRRLLFSTMSGNSIEKRLKNGGY